MPSSDTAPSKATRSRSQFQAVRAPATTRPARVRPASRPRPAPGRKATTSSSTTPATSRASSGAMARQSTCGTGRGWVLAWASGCTTAPPGSGTRGLGLLDDTPGRGLDPVQHRPGEEAEDDDGGDQRGQDCPLPPGQVTHGPVLLPLQAPLPHPLVGPEQVHRAQDDPA